MKRLKIITIVDSFTSSKFVLFLFGILICLLIPHSISKEAGSLLQGYVQIVLAIITFNLILCTLRKFKVLHRATLIIHLGSIVILIGGCISTFGYVATVNVYEGDITHTAFNWEAGRDMQLENPLKVAAINFDYYPIGVKIGVLENNRKAELIESRTGNSFTFKQYKIQIVRLDPRVQDVYLKVETLQGKFVGTMSTNGQSNLPADFPLDFKLVAFQDPLVKRMWADLELLANGGILKTGSSEVNNPFTSHGIQYFLTQVSYDNMGRPYAGIQITRDPGVPYIYTGFVIFSLGVLLALRRWKRQVL